MKRITRLECSVWTDNCKSKAYSFKWSRGEKIIRSVWGAMLVNSPMKTITYTEFLECVRDCKENSNVLFDDEYGNTLEIRRWSYRRK